KTEAAAIAHHARSQHGKARPASAVNWQVLNGCLIQHRSKVGRGGVDLRSFTTDVHSFSSRANRKVGSNVSDAAHLNSNLLRPEGSKPLFGNGHSVCTGLKLVHPVVA